MARLKKKNNGLGRPTLMTEATLNKLEDAFSLGCSDLEACFLAGISSQTLYDHQKQNPDFVERKAQLKERTVLRARRTVISSLDDVEVAQWYLERKRKSEFSTRTEKTGADGAAIQIDVIRYDDLTE